MVGEDKPSHTGHKDINETITKNKRVRVAALDVLQKKLPFKELISKFDEYTTFWHGTDLQICGTRRIDGIDIHYEAAHVCVSRVPGDFKGLVKLMIVVLSIKRQSIRVYEQLGAINHAIFDLSLEYPSLSMLPNSSKDDSFEFDDKELKKLLYDLPCPPDKKEKCVQDAIYDADLKFKKNFLAASKLHDILVNPHHAMDKISFIEPKVDIVEEESGSFQVAVELPGIEKRDIKVGIKGNIFWIDAKSRLFYDNSTKIHIQECNKHHFHRQITLPIFVRASDCSSSFENGLLIIKIKPTAVDLDHISIS
ncbi:hypothetical protein BDA99DRAFT_287967 [Phascolomyces articulosus]|uniref:SHSP domain-containing protein n=1 Tax=Phascolomyces articulosus TaxID=60185 RepID=A0AAD5JMV6_9FUNG|nr:hypothetical protein BDA99DRAFT_287967 [Phascolomyces articulosus]